MTRQETPDKLMKALIDMNEESLRAKIKIQFADEGDIGSDYGGVGRGAFELAIDYWAAPGTDAGKLLRGDQRVIPFPDPDSDVSDKMMGFGRLLAASILHGGAIPGTLHPAFVKFLGIPYPRPPKFRDRELVTGDEALPWLELYDESLGRALRGRLATQADIDM
jgi:hypothetical protein